MIPDQQIAAELGIPEGVVKSIRLKRWSVLKNFSQKKWNEDGYAALKRWNGAVDRIVEKYLQLFGHSAFKPGSKPWAIDASRKSIAIWIDRIGSLAPIIKDMEAARLNGDKPRSINWFIYRADGRACRWDMLWMDLMNREAEEARRKELDWRPSDADLPEGIEGFIKAAASPVTPTWVAQAKNRLKMLSRFIRTGEANADMRREFKQIETRLKDHGYLEELEL